MSDPSSALHAKKHSKGNDPVDKLYEILHLAANEYIKRKERSIY